MPLSPLPALTSVGKCTRLWARGSRTRIQTLDLFTYSLLHHCGMFNEIADLQLSFDRQCTSIPYVWGDPRMTEYKLLFEPGQVMHVRHNKDSLSRPSLQYNFTCHYISTFSVPSPGTQIHRTTCLKSRQCRLKITICFSKAWALLRYNIPSHLVSLRLHLPLEWQSMSWMSPAEHVSFQ